jgi:DNA-binding beta-propeller fold protein YncE
MKASLGLTMFLLASGYLAQVQGPEPLRLVGKIELPDVQGRIDHMSVDSKGGRLFMAALGNDTVEVFDLAAGKRAQTIRGLAEPQGVLFVPDANRILVAGGGDGSVRIFDASSLALVRKVDLGGDADNIRLDSATGRIFIGYGAGALAAIDVNGARFADIPLGAHPESFQLEKKGPRIFVNLPNARKIAVVDRNKGTVVARWSTGEATSNFPMALDEVHKRLFVICRAPARLVVLDTETGAVVATLPTVGDSDDVFYDEAVQRLYVSGGEGAIAVYRQVDADHYEETARLATAKGARTSFFAQALGRFFLAVRREGPNPAALWVYEAAR